MNEVNNVLPQYIASIDSYARVRPDGIHNGVYIRLAAGRALHLQLPNRLTKRFVDTPSLLHLLHENLLGNTLKSVRYDTVSSTLTMEVCSGFGVEGNTHWVQYASTPFRIELIEPE